MRYVSSNSAQRQSDAMVLWDVASACVCFSDSAVAIPFGNTLKEGMDRLSCGPTLKEGMDSRDIDPSILKRDAKRPAFDHTAENLWKTSSDNTMRKHS